MDPKTYRQTAAAPLAARSLGSTTVDRAQVRILLAHFSTHPLDEAAFVRELASLARVAERDGRRTLAVAARQILADWQAIRAGQAERETSNEP